MTYDPRTGITTYGAPDAAMDPSLNLAAEAAPSTATDFPPTREGWIPFADRASSYAQNWRPAGPETSNPEVDFYGSGGVADPYAQIRQAYALPASMSDAEVEFLFNSIGGVPANRGASWSEWLPVLSVLSGPITGALGLGGAAPGAASALTGESAALASAIGGAGGLGLTAAEAAALGTGAASVAAGGGLFGTNAGSLMDVIGQRAIQGGANAALSGGDPLRGALTGGLTGGLGQILPDVLGMFSPGNSGIPAVDAAALEPAGQFVGMQPTYSTMPGTTSGLFDNVPQYSTPAMTAFTAGEGMLPMSFPTSEVTSGLLLQDLPGVLSVEDSRTIGPIATQKALEEAGLTLNPLTGVVAPLSAQHSLQFSTPESEQSASRNASAPVDTARLAKIGAQLAKMAAGQGAPEDAPQRAEGQSDAEYAQSLASYINVDAAALAEMGLVPGTPEYYDYLMTQLDATIEDLVGTLDVDAPDLEQQLRSKTREELDALRRALFVRGQLGQLMGSGTYTDPVTGRAEEVITNGRRVNPGVAAYHRGLGRTIEDFSKMTPFERKQAIGGFLGREPDIYGMQARADERAQQELLLEDLKRRRGMFSQSQF